MDISSLQKCIGDQQAYRLRQIKRALYVDLVEDWQYVTTLPKNLRELLARSCPLDIHADVQISGDNFTVKALMHLIDGKRIETVLMRHEDGRRTVCVSSQVGCPLGCTFCATGRGGFSRNLTIDEIVEQVLFWNRYLKPSAEKVTNVVFMGMGEPLLNYSNVLSAIRTLNDPDGFGIGARRISISTSGIAPKIRKLANELLQVNLALSLHAPNDCIRSQLMPINKQFPLKQVMSAVSDYVTKTNRQVMFEYLMIRGVNDADEQARELAVLVDHPLYFINLIPYNPTGAYQPSSSATIRRFKQILLRAGRHVTQRYGFGQDIAAACGQLAAKNNGSPRRTS